MVLATRPAVAAGKYLRYNYAVFGFAPQGPYWREIKKISSLELLSKIRLEMLKHGHLKAMKCVAKEMDCLIGNWLEDHKKKKLEGGDHEQDFINVMLSTFPVDKLIYGYDRDTVIKATILVLIVGGFETIFLSLTWALSLLLNHPHDLKRAQDELDVHVGRDRHADESDIKNLVNLQANVKETLRLYPPRPVVPCQAMEDCQLGGYHVPKGTHLLVNIWKLHRDPKVWSNPNEVRPERFLTTHADVDFKAQQYEYIPFSAGRRPCPGISLATHVFHLALARVLHGFDVNPLHALMDMTEGVSITLPKARPLKVLLTPRLPSKLYED
ncbi:xanthotoxin 5-hydroxylase CYP82C4-like [Macadamia integrifolia]|uniref:xanthotoxin 5-hydroxylase CYP82C4-like n=1 Tax=Macadamia integrifolia TaxID=60698 RepID=UPI001C4F76D6|nr:xanthotoxin 5-hydroxylase CYP82C4-like [Macadamia integrifolia]